MAKLLRVLMVEDSEDDALLLTRELERCGYALTARRVETPEQMRAALEHQSWDVILAYYTLPRFSAPAALELLKASGLDLPFIVISGTIGEEVAVEAMIAGAHDYLMKGRLARLIPAIEREMRDARVRRDRRRAEEALHDSQAQLSIIFDHAPVMMLLVDRTLRLRRVNRAGIALANRPQQDLIDEHLGNALGCLHALEDPRGCQYSPACKQCGAIQTVLKTFAEGTPQRALEAHLPLSRGRTHTVLHFLVSTALVNLSGTEMVLLCMEDVTDRKRAADALTQYAFALEQSNQKLDASRAELEQYIHTSSHDLRAPIVSIHGFASLLMEKAASVLDDTQRGYVDRILTNAQTIEVLLGDLLRVSRAAPHNVPALEIDLMALAREIFECSARCASDRHIRCVLGQPGPHVFGDAPSLKEVIRHLVDNAIQFMPQKQGATVEFGYDPSAESPQGDCGAFYVRDNGAGIPAADQNRIFQLFQRGSRADMTTPGTGVGLAIVKRVITAHGGRVWIASAPGQGCTVYFAIRTASPPAAHLRHPAAEGSEAVKSVQQPRLLWEESDVQGSLPGITR
jgi:signal transduction histidine kinase